jgi:hypothetical protein
MLYIDQRPSPPLVTTEIWDGGRTPSKRIATSASRVLAPYVALVPSVLRPLARS